jgi:hypothetical protein
MTDYPVTQADGSIVQDVPSAAWGVGVADGTTISSLPAWAYIAGAALVDTVELGVVPSTAAILNALAADILKLSVALRIAHQGLLIETLHLHDLQIIVRAVRVLESLGLGSALVGQSRLLQALVEEIALDDSARLFFGGFLSETIGVGSTSSRLYQAGAQVGEDLVLADLLARQFITRIIMRDDFELDDSQVLKGIYNGTLADRVFITGGMVMPSGEFTTWAINTRTNAVTEYQNYAFNSFAQMGHRFLGATDQGLYVLDGEVDIGQAIQTRMRSGIMQLAGSKFTMFKGAYLGIRTNDDGRDFILKLIYGDGPGVKETCYKVVVQNLKTAKVNLGKGIRARYISWELETLGADFDFDGIEFVPISSQRRV